MKNFSFSIIGLVALSILLLNVNTTPASADFFSGLKSSATGMGYSPTDNSATMLYSKIGAIISISTMFIGVVFLGLIIYAGFIWMMARGNEQEVERAKNIIIYAIIGLAVVLGAYAITQLAATLWLKS
ncbi:MAG: hypothetical protein PHF50_00330 [Patescibacteria group bacterium]|nr:hypothetical protein [Patescibacteria group bacterium]